MAVVRVKKSIRAVTFWMGQHVVLIEDEPWEDSHPFVRAQPHWFEADERADG